MGFFSSSPISVVSPNPTYPAWQDIMNRFMQGQVIWDNGVPTLKSDPYKGPLSPDPTKGVLPGVYNAYSPAGNPGTSFMQNLMQNNNLSQTYENPELKNEEQWGMPTATSGEFEKNLAQYGIASEGSGANLKSVAQYGISSLDSGDPLKRLAYGMDDKNSPAKYLLPFLQGTSPVAYKPPTIP